MHKVIIWYNKKRKTIWMFLIIIIVLYLFVQLLNNLAKTTKRNNYKNNILQNNFNYEMNTINFDDNKSAISGDTLTESQIKSTKVIDDFVTFCNEGKIEEAYNLISQECKEQVYPTREDFNKSYYTKVFNGNKKTVTIDNWINNVYRVKFSDNSLSTGIYSEENIIQDYITIVSDENNEYRLNINSYLGKQNININYEYKDININVTEINTYMDYQEYTYEIKNNSKNTILLDNRRYIDSMCLEDENNISYSAITNELSEDELKILPNETKTVKIKYYSKFSSSKNIKYVVFSRVILNYTIGENNNYESIKIQL